MASTVAADRMRVRAFRVADIEPARALWQATENLGLGEADAPDALTVFLERNADLSAVAYDCEASDSETGDRLVGAVLCGHDGRRGTLYHLAVAATHRRLGIGAALVGHCRAALAAAGIRRCNLLIYPHNHAGRVFWQRFGWETKPWELMQAAL